MTYLLRFINLLSIWVLVFFGPITLLLINNSIYFIAVLPMFFIIVHIVITLRAARYYIVDIGFKENGFTIVYYEKNRMITSSFIQYSNNQIQFLDNAIGLSTLKGSRCKIILDGFTIEQFIVGKWTINELKHLESTYKKKASEYANK